MNTPKEIAANYVILAQNKVKIPLTKLFLLATMAGIFIAFGGVAATTASVSVSAPSVGKFLGACIFPGGLTMVLLAGSELFTGNCLLSIPLLERKITLFQLLRNWIVVYAGNFLGSILVSALCIFSHQPSIFEGQVALSLFQSAASKTTLPFWDALLKGIACNFLVCIAVWASFAAKEVISKIAAVFFPIMFFVVSGFEHSIANMFYISAAIFAKNEPAYLSLATASGIDLTTITWKHFLLNNLLPVTIGNIIGGAILVGVTYWYIYLHEKPNS